MPIDNKFIAIRLETARRLANNVNVRDPNFWQAKIDEVENILHSSKPTVRLVELYQFYSSAKACGLKEVLDVSKAGQFLDRPPLPLLEDLSMALREGLLSFGTSISAIVMHAYEVSAQDAIDRLVLLKLLAEIGDINMDHFFNNLQEEHIKLAVQAEHELITSIGEVIPSMEKIETKCVEDMILMELEDIKNIHKMAKNHRLGNC